MKIEDIKHIPTRWLAMWRANQNPESKFRLGFKHEKTPEGEGFWMDAIVTSFKNPYPNKYPNHEWIKETGAFEFLFRNGCTYLDVWRDENFKPLQLSNLLACTGVKLGDLTTKPIDPNATYSMGALGDKSTELKGAEPYIQMSLNPEFVKGETVEVKDFITNELWQVRTFIASAEFEGKQMFVTYNYTKTNTENWLICRKLTPNKYTIDELRELAANQLGLDINQIEFKL